VAPLAKKVEKHCSEQLLVELAHAVDILLMKAEAQPQNSDNFNQSFFISNYIIKLTMFFLIK
jgi:hypothetical protein